MSQATRNDWRIEPFPDKYISLKVDRTYSNDEFERITLGVVPQQMEDKWFIFYESPWLYLHRSWTGYCIFKVRFESSLEGAKVVEALVNRNPSQSSDFQNADLLAILLDSRAERGTRQQMLDFIRRRNQKG